MSLRSASIRFLILLFLLGFIPATAVGAAALRQDGGTITLSQYWGLVEQTRQVLSADQSPDDPLLELIEKWRAIKYVELEDGSLVPLDASYMTALLDASENGRALKLLNALLEAHQNYPPQLYGAQDLKTLDEILASPEFQWSEQKPNPLNEWFQNLLDRFFDWLDQLLGSKASDGIVSVKIPRGSVFSTIMTVALVLVIGYVLWGLFKDMALESKLPGNGDSDEEILTYEAAFARAQSLSRGGDYRSAVRYLYLSSLLLLDERGLLRYDRSKTNREYLRSVSGSSELSGPLQDVIDVFDNVWYGYHTLDEASFKHYSERVDELKEKKQP